MRQGDRPPICGQILCKQMERISPPTLPSFVRPNNLPTFSSSYPLPPPWMVDGRLDGQEEKRKRMGRGRKEEGSTISIHWAVAVKKRERKFHSLSLLLLSRAISPPSIPPPTPSPKRTIQPVVSLSLSDPEAEHRLQSGWSAVGFGGTKEGGGLFCWVSDSLGPPCQKLSSAPTTLPPPPPPFFVLPFPPSFLGQENLHLTPPFLAARRPRLPTAPLLPTSSPSSPAHLTLPLPSLPPPPPPPPPSLVLESQRPKGGGRGGGGQTGRFS